jgi:polar amino acid transport system ATP-binding protein/sulfate transport system ATP-binding protein
MAADIYYEVKETLLKVTGVNVAFGDNQILRDLNMEVKNLHRPGKTQGQVVALLGPSGVGKTTLFRVLAGLDKPDTGEVLVTPEMVPVRRGMVGVVAQHYPLFQHRTVLSNLVVAGRQAGLKKEEATARANDILKRFNLEGSNAKYPSQLSGGMRQRVSIAQQFMCSEHFLLMDEPFSGLDLVAIERVTHFIDEIAASDELKTFVIVTHDVTAAIEVADQILLLGRDRDEKGQIIPGARVQASYNLIERNLAWRHGITSTPEYAELVKEIREVFPKL